MSDFEGDPPGSIGTQSMEAPFEVLRVRCRCFGFYQVNKIGAEWHQSENGLRNAKRWPDCQGRGWIPEPDVEKAEFRALLVLAKYDSVKAQGVLADIGATGAKGLALRAAVAWMKEQTT